MPDKNQTEATFSIEKWRRGKDIKLSDKGVESYPGWFSLSIWCAVLFEETLENRCQLPGMKAKAN